MIESLQQGRLERETGTRPPTAQRHIGVITAGLTSWQL